MLCCDVIATGLGLVYWSVVSWSFDLPDFRKQKNVILLDWQNELATKELR